MNGKFGGILLSFFGAGVAIFLGELFPFLGFSIFALLLGIAVRRFIRIPEWLSTGLNQVGKNGLQYSILFLGFTLSFSQVSAIGLSSLKLSLFTIFIAFVTAYFLVEN
ncbi:hypothetical protein STRDD10_01171 [Streptococcus sp. DD10]|nr:hypothetical protein STRDD10_01171 [Streptococcus sp. DD10]